MEIRPYESADEQAVIELWSIVLPDAAPHNDPRTSLVNKLQADDGLLLVAVVDDVIAGSVMGGYDGHRGWIYSLAVLPDYHRRGIASALCRKLEELLIDRGCLKLNLQVRCNNSAVIEFYEQIGFHVEDIISLGKRLYE